jgi:hypothetical protein
MKFQRTTGGRPRTWPKRKRGGDCVCRSLAVALDLPYPVVHTVLKRLNCGNPDTGIYTGRVSVGAFMMAMGFKLRRLKKYVPFSAMSGKGTKIVAVCGHVATIKNGIYYDRRLGLIKPTDRVYGYWLLRKA